MRTPVLLALLIAGCATLADVDRARNSWHGATYDEVVLRWGAPSGNTTLDDGRQVFSWVSEGSSGGGYPASVSVFGGTGGGGIGATIGLPGMSGGWGEPQRCQRTLTFRDGRVTEQSWIGQPSLCSAFGRY